MRFKNFKKTVNPFIFNEAISQWDFCNELLTLFQLSRPVISKSHHLTAIGSRPQPSSTTKSKVTSPVFRICRVIALPPFSQHLKQKLPSLNLAGNPQTCYCSVSFALLSPGPSSTHFFYLTYATEHRLLMLPAACSRFGSSLLLTHSWQHLPCAFLTPGLILGGDERKLFCKVLAHVAG